MFLSNVEVKGFIRNYLILFTITIVFSIGISFVSINIIKNKVVENNQAIIGSIVAVNPSFEKEIINVKNGKRMGFITDIDMDVNEGKVISFSISGDSGRGFFSRGYEEEAISWNDILKIGCDTIIVNIGSEFNLDEFNI